MDSETLHCCLKLLIPKKLKTRYLVIARDQLPLVDYSKLPLALIVNCSDSNSRGSHWISFYVYRVKHSLYGDYFDSYSNPLSKYNITTPFRIIQTSTKVLQSNDSIVCGLYALFYLYWRCRGQNIRNIENRFSIDLSRNDTKIRNYYKILVRLKQQKTSHQLSCCSRLVNKL